MKSGKMVFSTVDPEKGVELERFVDRHLKWEADWGCYCCQHHYSALENPFSRSGGRIAWDRRPNGLQECMLAWRMIGNGLDHDNTAESSILGILALVPEGLVSRMRSI